MNRLTKLLEKYAKPAISGQGGHDATFATACFLWRNSDNESDVWQALNWYNDHMCHPAWNEKELTHKLADSRKAVGADIGKYGRKRTDYRPPPKVKKLPPIMDINALLPKANRVGILR